MQRLQSKQEESTEEEEMKQQQRIAIIKHLTKKIRSKGSMDAKTVGGSRSCLRCTVRKHGPTQDGRIPCKMVCMAGAHEEEKMKKGKMEEMHQRMVEKMIKSAEGSAGLIRKITKPTMWRGGVQILKNEEEDARLLDRCEAKRKQWAKHWQCDERYIICKTHAMLTTNRSSDIGG